MRELATGGILKNSHRSRGNYSGLSRRGGVIVWIVNDATINGSETGSSFRQALYFMELGFSLHDTMIWNKRSCYSAQTNRYYPAFEYMFIFSKGKPKTANLIRDRRNKRVGQLITGRVREPNGEMKQKSSAQLGKTTKPFGVRFNIWDCSTSGQVSQKWAKKHVATFPLKLARDHIYTWSNPGDVVLDPFMGSGTVGVAALQNGRKFVGIEYVESYFNVARERIESETAQQRISFAQ